MQEAPFPPWLRNQPKSKPDTSQRHLVQSLSKAAIPRSTPTPGCNISRDGELTHFKSQPSLRIRKFCETNRICFSVKSLHCVWGHREL